MATWREIRREILESIGGVLTLLRGAVAPASYYKPMETAFSAFENVSPEEIELICDGEMRLLLSGYQTDNIRLQFDDRNRPPVGLLPNPSLDPYMRSAIDRFSDIVRDLYIIRVYSHQIRLNFLKSRIARVVLFHITKKADQLLNPIVVEGWSPRDEGFHDSDFGLNNLTRSVAAVRSSIRCYAEIVQAIYEKNLSGGEVIDLLEEKLQRVVCDRQELQFLLRNAWKIFFEIAGNWMSRGVLEDPDYEFFIWPRNKIKALSQSVLDNNLQRYPGCAESIKSDNYVMVPDLCPIQVRTIMGAIYRCGRSVQDSQEGHSFDWSKIENPARFIQKVLSLSADMSQASLNKMKNDGQLSDFISCFHITLLNSPWLSEVAGVMTTKELTQRKYNEVADGVLKSLTHLTLHRHIAYFSFLKNFKFVKANSDLFEALLSCNMDAVNGQSAVTRKSNSDIACLPERISVAVHVPPTMVGIFTNDTINKCALVFRLQLRLHIAGLVLDECRSNLPRTGIADVGARYAWLLLKNLSTYLLLFRTQLSNAIREAVRHFQVQFARASRVEDVSGMQRECLCQIFKDASLTEKHIQVVDDLMGLIDAFAYNKDLETVTEHYNMWLESVESTHFLGRDRGFL